jgi:hypothetical protein
MFTLVRGLGIAALVVGLVCGFESSVDAQFGRNRNFPGVNPNPQIAPGVSLQQFSFNVGVLGRTYGHIPPYVLGYNPYVSPISSFNLGGNPAAFSPGPFGGGGYTGGYGGSGGNPYAGGYSGGGIDPSTGMPIGSGGGYTSTGGNPYTNPYGGYNYDTGATLKGYATLGISVEQARILREQANQAKLDTRKKLVDTLAYLRANEYTFTQEQADIARKLLERVQILPTNAEIVTGKSLNILLKDLAKFNSKQLRSQTVTVDEDILKQLNVTGSNGNLGLLRNDGQIPWPLVFDDDSVLPAKDRQAIDTYAKNLFLQAANNGKLDGNTLKDLESSVSRLREDLKKKINVIKGPTYLEGQRFLDDLDAAVIALKRGDAAVYLDFTQKFAKGGRTVQELVDYMKSKGLSFAPAMSGDDGAYQAMQTALAAQSLALHAQIAAASKDN